MSDLEHDIYDDVKEWRDIWVEHPDDDPEQLYPHWMETNLYDNDFEDWD